MLNIWLYAENAEGWVLLLSLFGSNTTTPLFSQFLNGRLDHPTQEIVCRRDVFSLNFIPAFMDTQYYTLLLNDYRLIGWWQHHQNRWLAVIRFFHGFQYKEYIAYWQCNTPCHCFIGLHSFSFQNILFTNELYMTIVKPLPKPWSSLYEVWMYKEKAELFKSLFCLTEGFIYG